MRLLRSILTAGILLLAGVALSPAASAGSGGNVLRHGACVQDPDGNSVCYSVHRACGDLADGSACNPRMLCGIGAPQEACDAIDPYCTSKPGVDGCEQYFQECANAPFSAGCDLAEDACSITPEIVPAVCVGYYDTLCFVLVDPHLCFLLDCNETGLPVCLNHEHCTVLKPSAVLRPTDTFTACAPFSIPPGTIPDVDLLWVYEAAMDVVDP